MHYVRTALEVDDGLNGLSTAGLEMEHSELRQIVQDAILVTSFLNIDDENARLEPHILSEWMISIGFRLLHFRPLEENYLLNPTDRCFHIGMATLLSTLYIQIGSRRYLKYRMVGTILQKAVDSCLDLVVPEVMLWLLLLGGPSVLAGADPRWYRAAIRHTLDRLDWPLWPNISTGLQELPWIRRLHDKPAQALYDCTVQFR